jgi:hypothetical protein
VVTRRVEVPPGRLVGWVERYRRTHPDAHLTAVDGGLLLRDDQGASASLQPLRPFEPGANASGDDLVAALAEHAAQPVATALLLVRRGGYAVGVAEGQALAHSKVGTRYVQSRTAAGGWSQQRFARRRAGQAQQLIAAAAGAWAALPREPAPSVVVTGGDRALAEQLLHEPQLTALLDLGVARHLDVRDPRREVLRQAAERAHAVLVVVREPEPPATTG